MTCKSVWAALQHHRAGGELPLVHVFNGGIAGLKCETRNSSVIKKLCKRLGLGVLSTLHFGVQCALFQ